MIEPRRLIDQPGASELGEALRAARAAKGGEEQVARLWQQLGRPEGAGRADHGGGSGAATLGAKSWTIMSVLTLAVLGAVVYFALGARERVQSPDERSDLVAAKTQTGQPSRTAGQPAAVAAPAPALKELAPEPAPDAHRIGGRQRERAREVPRRPTPAAVDPNAELALLTRAEQALELTPTRTLAILSEHAQRFPDGLLAQEREILSIDAELALGRSAAAAARARAFLLRFPSSPHRHRFASLLAIDPPTAGDHKTGAPRIPTRATPDRR